MATLMKPTPTADKETQINRKIRIPKQRYQIRVTSEDFSISRSSGNPMQTLKSEIVGPDVVMNPIDGSKLSVSGATIKDYYVVLGNPNDPKKAQESFNRYCELRAKVGKPLPEGEGIDIENPPKIFSGLILDAILVADEYAQREDPTPEQRAKGELGAIIKDQDGNEIKSYNIAIAEILGLANVAVAGAIANKKPF